jgi:hypothetical protein
MSWLDDDEVAQHPLRTLALMFLFGLVGGGGIGYFNTGRSPTWAVIFGITAGVILDYIAWKSLRDKRWPQRRRTRRFGIEFVWIGIGGAIVIAGLATGNPQFALVGLPLIALGLFWRLIKRSLPPR